MYNYSETLNPKKALIWRIVHRDNLPWILDNGLHCGNSSVRSDSWVHIGSDELISKRATHPVPLSPGGMLNDYVPFYFTPFSVMLKNIRSGRGVVQRANDEIVILVSSLRRIDKLDLRYLFTDSHAYYQWSNYYDDLTDLDKIDWSVLQRRDFRRDPDDLAKFERYQAEALIHEHCPVEALAGVICHTEAVRLDIKQQIMDRGLELKVIARPRWYFT